MSWNLYVLQQMRLNPTHILAAMMLSAIGVSGVGPVDPNFGNSPWAFQERGESEIREIALTPGGKVLISTYFAGLVRLNFDGSIDPTFSCAVPRVRRAVAAGNKIYVAHGPEYFPDGSFGYQISRLNENGSVDGSFARATVIPPHLWNVYVVVRSMAPTADGGCVIAGLFDRTSEAGSTNIARFKANGSLDMEFSKNINPSPQPYSICPLPNGQFILSEAIWQGVQLGYYCAVIRLNADGTTDPAFRAEFHSTVDWPNTLPMMTEIAPYPNLSVLIAGSCNMYGRRPDDPQKKYIGAVARLLPDGSLDSAFQGDTNVWIARAIGVQSDGKIVIASHSYDTALVRLLPDGRRDASFPALSFQPRLLSWVNLENGEPQMEPPTAVLGLVVDQWDDINIVGRFTSLGGVNRTYLARILGGATDNPPTIAPRIDKFATVEFAVTGPKNYLATVETTPDFTDWLPLTNFVLNGSNTFGTSKDLNSGFFRVQVSRP